MNSMKKIFASTLAKLAGVTPQDDTHIYVHVRSAKSRKSQPGAKRKGVKYMKPPKCNVERWNRKPCTAGMAHEYAPRGALISAPTMDQTRALEQRIGHKIHVRLGKCYLRIVGFQSHMEIPLNATSEQVTNMICDNHSCIGAA